VAGILLANDIDFFLAADHLAVAANGFYGGFDFHALDLMEFKNTKIIHGVLPRIGILDLKFRYL